MSIIQPTRKTQYELNPNPCAAGSEDFLEYFNSNADGDDRSKDDAISKPFSLFPRFSLIAIPTPPSVVSLEGRMFPVEIAYLQSATSNLSFLNVSEIHHH